MYLVTSLDCSEYMCMLIDLIPQNIIKQYKLWDKTKNGYIYMKIEHGMYGLPHAGILVNKILRYCLESFGY